jgi:uncharacterized protein YndB with AHSA1/START domain
LTTTKEQNAMPDIVHGLGIKADVPQVYNALATLKGLSGWWTDDTTGNEDAGGVIHFRFATRGFIDMKVIARDPDKRVAWEVVNGPDSWSGTKVSFDLKRDDDFTRVLFKHEGWKEQNEFMHHCSTKWGTFLMSLKSFVETGKGAAFPNDVHIGRND